MTTCTKMITVTLLSFAASGEAFIPAYPHSPESYGTRSTSLYGGNLLDRFVRVTKANLNKMVSRVENPEKIIEQAVIDMQSDLVRVRQAYAEATASQRRLQRQKEELAGQASEWYDRANLALQRGKEELAREALSRREVYVEKVNSLQSQLDTQGAATDKLHNAMMELEQKIQEANAKKEQLIARARTAKSTQMVNDMLSGLTGTTSMDAFHRMEAKVEALESAAEVSGETNLLTDSVEMEFRSLEKSSNVDNELEKMKADMKFLGSSSSSSSSSSSREEKMTTSKNEQHVSLPVTAKDEIIFLG